MQKEFPMSFKSPKAGNGNRLTRYSSYLYLAMALLIVAVATASIFALNRSVGKLPEYSIPSFSTPDNTLEKPDPSTPSKPNDAIQIVPDNPVFGEESNIVDTSSDEPTVKDEPKYVLPIEECRISKECALETLVFSATMKDYRAHTGVDLAAPLGTEVRCYAAGTIESIREDEFYGVTVSVRHEQGLVTVYANLDKELSSNLAVGQAIHAGDVIGKVGKTAMAETADEPHLHFEMLLNNAYINPKDELPDA